MSRLRVVQSGQVDPVLNMGIDEALLQAAGPPTLRLYGWSPPGLSLGYFQASALFRALAGPHVIVRRLTGGGAIYHDQEITFALTIDQAALPAVVAESYGLIHEALRQAMARVGLRLQRRTDQGFAGHARPQQPWCLADTGPHDLVTRDGRKLLGSAQRRIARPIPRLLHHGSVVLRAPGPTPAIGAVANLVDPTPLVAPLQQAIATELAHALALVATPGALTPAEVETAHRLAERYRDPRFTFCR